MSQIPEIDLNGAKELLDLEGALFVDIRDGGSFDESHIPGALHLNDTTIDSFLTEQDKAQKVVVYCYHGNNSKQATLYLKAQGFEDVFSMAGGFEGWRQIYKGDSSSPK